jgi:hypothetical protein
MIKIIIFIYEKFKEKCPPMNIIWPSFVLWPFLEVVTSDTTQLYLHPIVTLTLIVSCIPLHIHIFKILELVLNMLCQRISMHIWMSCKVRTNIHFHVNHNLSTIQDNVFDDQLVLRWSCMTRCPCIFELFWEKIAYFGGKELLKMKGSLQINPWNILVQFNVMKLFARHYWSWFMKKTSTCWAIISNDGPTILT